MSEENKTTEEEVVEATAPIEGAKPVEVAKEVAETSSDNEVPSTEAPEAPVAPTELPHRDLKPGMVVRVHEIIKDVNAKGEERERTQVFEGVILGFSASGIARTMTVRKESNGFGVEKIYPLSSPHVAKIEVVKEQQVRRSKLWFLRRGFKRRLKEANKA